MGKRELEESQEDFEESEDIARDYLRMSLVLSFLTQKPLSIELVEPIRAHEVSLLKLLTKVTEGTTTKVEKNSIKVVPGRLTGGDFTFECEKSMPLTYYLEPIVLLFPFTSKFSSIILTYSNLSFNSNNNNKDNDNKDDMEDIEDENIFMNNKYYSSLECFSSVCTVILQMIGCEVDFKFKEPYEVVFKCGPVKKIEPIILIKSPKMKRIRGSVVVRNLQPSLGKSAIIGAKRVLDRICDNTWIALSSPSGRFRPVLFISLIAEGSKNCIFTSNNFFQINSHTSNNSINNYSNNNKDNNNNSLNKILNLFNNNNNNNKDKDEKKDDKNIGINLICEKIGEECSYRLCNEILLDSVIDTTHQHILIYFMSLSGDEKVSKIRLSRLNRYSIMTLRLIKKYLGIIFKFEEILNHDSLLLKCVGLNYQNINISTF